MNPTHVAVVTPSFFPVVGGAEMGVHEIYSRMPDDYLVTILTPATTSPADLVAHHSRTLEANAQYKVMRFKTPASRLQGIARRLVSFSGIPTVLAIRQLNRHQAIDVVNVHFARPNLLPLLYVKLILRRPSILSLVGRTDVYHLASPVEKLLIRVAMALSTVVTQNTGFYLQGLPAQQKVREIPYGVDSATFSREARNTTAPKHQSHVTLVCVQRLVQVKAVDRLIETVAMLPANYCLNVIGKGPERDRLEKLATSICPGKVKFLGYVPEEELASSLGRSDIFVFHSRFETFGVVFAQAMATGLPIVAANTSCVSLVVEHEKNGLLVAPDDVVAMKQAVEKLVSDDRLYLAIRDENLAKASRAFNWTTIARQYAELITSMK